MDEPIKIGTFRLPCTNGTVRSFPVDPIETTADTAAVVVTVKIIEKESVAAKVGLDLHHGVDLQAFAPYKTYLISLTTLSTSYDPPCILVGGTKPTTDGPLNRLVQPVIKTEGDSADSSVTVELWIWLKTV